MKTHFHLKRGWVSMRSYMETFQCNDRYKVVHKDFYHYHFVEKSFCGVFVSVNNMKMRLKQNHAFCQKLSSATWSFTWHNKYIRNFCSGKVNTSMKRIVAKNIVNNYGLKTLKDFLRLKGWGCLCDNWKPSFLPRLIFNWCTFPNTAVTWMRKKSSVNQSEFEK